MQSGELWNKQVQLEVTRVLGGDEAGSIGVIGLRSAQGVDC
jgi:hypothetical protein